MSATVTRITQVRMKVARSELMCSTPTLAKMAVSAANTADSTAQSCQEENALEFMSHACATGSGTLAHVPAKACPGLDPGWVQVRRQEHAPLNNWTATMRRRSRSRVASARL